MARARYIGETKKGKCYELQYCQGRGKSALTKRWYPKEGWSDNFIQQQLKKVLTQFEADCKAGKIKTRKQEREDALNKDVYDVKNPTFEQYAVNCYMKAISITASEYSISSYNGLLRTRLIPTFGAKKLSDITPSEITDFLLSLQSSGLSTGTALKYYGFLSAMFKMAYKNDIIEKNPMDKVDRPKNTKAEGNDKKVDAFTEEEVKYIVKMLDNEPLRWKAYILLMLDTGIRRGECSGLTWENVDFANSRITISQSLNYTSDKGVYVDTPKNGKSRTIDVDNDIMNLLKVIKNNQDLTVQSEYVFTYDCSSTPLHPSVPTKFMQRFGERYGITGMHPHKLRHTWASIAITNGADVESVSEKLGHHDAGFTLRQYTHANEESIKKAGDIFRNAIKG